MRLFGFGFLVSILLLLAGSAGAQVNPGTESGVPAYGRFGGSDFDQINLLNGNLHIDIPILSVKERGRTFSWHLYYEPVVWNLIWVPVPNPSHLPKDPSYYYVTRNGSYPGLVLASPFDWHGSLGPLSPVQTCPTTDQPYQVEVGATVVGPDETEHSVPLRNEVGQYPCQGSTLSGPATDGSGIIYNTTTGVITLPDGTQIHGQTIEDANGNLASMTGSDGTPYAGTASYTDMLGRSLMTTTQGPTTTYTSPDGVQISGWPQYTLMTVTDTNGQQQVYRIDYQLIDLDSNMCTAVLIARGHNCNEDVGDTVLVAQKLTLPNGKTYLFTYNDNTPGQLARVDLPTGGYITYTYANSYFSQPGTGGGITPPNYTGRQGVASRTVNESGNVYQWTYAGIAGGTTTVTDPDGNVQIHTYGYLVDPVTKLLSATEYEQSVTYEDSSGNTLRTVTNTYGYDHDPNSGLLIDGRVISKTTTLDNGQANQTQTDYETFQYSCSDAACPGTATRMNPTEIREYDYGAGSPGPLMRRTDYTYLHNNPTNGATYTALNIVNKVLATTVYDGSSNQVSQTVNEYDNYTAGISPSSAVQHDSARGTTYTTRGNLTAVSHWRNTDGAMLTSRNQYDDAGNMLSTTDPKNNTTSYDYTDSWYSGTGGSTCAPSGEGKAYLTKITNALGQVTKTSYYSCSGLLGSTTDPNNQTSTQSYDLFDRPLVSTFPDGGQTTNTYDDTNLITTTSKLLTSGASIFTREHYDQLGRAIEDDLCEDGTAGCTSPIQTDITYDGLDQKITETNPYRSTSDSTYGVTTYAYDGLGRTKSATKPDGSVVQTQYCGPSTMVTDEASHWRRSRTDGLGRLVEVDEPNSTTATVNVCPGTGEPTWVTTYGYNALGDLLSVVQGGSRNRSFVYNSLEQLTSSTNPEAGAVSYTYDADGNVLTKADARSITTTNSYDALNRVTGVTYSNGDPSVSYTYDQSACLGAPACYNIGRRTSMTDAGGSESLAYDPMGRELEEQRTTNSVTKTTSYTYNLAGDLLTLTYPSGRVITYTYDSAGRASTAKDLTNGINYAFGTCQSGACYAPQGAVSQLQNGTNLASTYIYNDRLQPCWLYASTNGTIAAGTSCTATDPGPGNILDLKYNFSLGAGDNGNVSGITNNRDTTRSQSFTYDQVNRILSGQTSATTGSNCWGEAYSYDQWANLQSLAYVSGYTGCSQEGTWSAPATADNQLPSTVATYDSSGNVLTDSSNIYQWNAESEIKSAAGVNYTYDGDGNRLEKSNGKIYWYGAGTEILDESDLSGNFTNEYVFFDGKRIAMRNVSTGTIYYYAEDMLGSSRTIVQAGQTSVCYDADFYPFGGERDVTVSCTQNYKFEGKERDSETQNDDFGARYYSWRVGRWLSADWSAVPAPVPYANLTNPQTLNLYAMVSDDPESFSDLDGHETEVTPEIGNADENAGELECGAQCTPEISARIKCVEDPTGCEVTKEEQQQAQTAQPSWYNKGMPFCVCGDSTNAKERATEAAEAAVNLALAKAKISAAAGISTTSESGVGALAAAYLVVSASGNVVAGAAQGIGAATGYTKSTETAAEAAAVGTSLAGMVTLVATNGDLNKAGLAAAAEGIVTSSPKDLATGGTGARAAKALDFIQNVHRVEGAITSAVRDWIYPVSVY